MSYRAASLSLGGEGFIIQASITLASALVFQTIVMGLYMALREKKELRACFVSWKTSIWVGLAGALASIGWFTAMTIQQAALVRALGQIELVFTIATATLIFKERINKMEFIGIFLILAGIIILILK